MVENRKKVIKLDKVVVSNPSFSKSKLLIGELSQVCHSIVANTDGKRFSEAEMINFLNESGATNLILGVEPFTRRVIEACPQIRRVGKYGVGCDNVDMSAIREHGISFGYQEGVNKRSVSELALAFMIGHFRNVTRCVSLMQKGIWNKNGGRELTGKTVGIVGFGHIGSDLASLLGSFSVRILANDILDKEIQCKKYGGRQVDLNELLDLSDVVTVHVPGGLDTKNLISRSKIDSMKRGAFLINTSRGGAVDFDAAVAAVKEGKLSGFAADVFPLEPYSTAHLHIDEGFYFTPHIGGSSEEAIIAMGRSAIAGLVEGL